MSSSDHKKRFEDRWLGGIEASRMVHGAIFTWARGITTLYATNAAERSKRGHISIFDNCVPECASLSSGHSSTGLRKKTWGSRAYPVDYAYDSQGRMTSMTTWRDVTTGSGAAATVWKFNSRGFVTNKVYANGVGPRYTYTAAGRLSSRQWVRGVSADYDYNNAGELASVDYSDGTPDVSYTYNRRGQPLTRTRGRTTRCPWCCDGWAGRDRPAGVLGTVFDLEKRF